MTQGFDEGEISSFMIPKDMTFDLYTGNDKSGEKRSFVGNDYLDSNQSMFCQEVLDTQFKDSVMSVVVGNAKSLWKANGRWEQIATSSAQNDFFIVHYGFKTANTDNDRLS